MELRVPTLKMLALFLAMAAFFVAACWSNSWSSARQPDDAINTVTVLWIPTFEERREELAPGTEPGDYSMFEKWAADCAPVPQ